MHRTEKNTARTAASYIQPLLSNLGEGGLMPPVIPTGFTYLDQAMGGWRSGLHLVAGEPGCGKSALALHAAQAAAASGYPVLYLAFDAEPEFLVLRMLCQHRDWDQRLALDGGIEQPELLRAAGEMTEVLDRIAIVPADPMLDAAAVEDLVRGRIAASERKHCLVIIDYLQVWAAGTRQFSEFRHEIAKLTTALRQLALDLSSPVLAISSQNRLSQGEPTLSSLEGTSDLEYSADSVCFLIHVERSASQRGYLAPEESLRKSRTVSLSLRKNHFGEVGSRVVKFMPQSGAFDEESMLRTTQAMG